MTSHTRPARPKYKAFIVIIGVSSDNGKTWTSDLMLEKIKCIDESLVLSNFVPRLLIAWKNETGIEEKPFVKISTK